MKRIYVCSRLSATTEADRLSNVRLARRLCHRAMLEHGIGLAFAPHGFFPEFLDDTDFEEREMGMLAGEMFLELCDELWVFTKHGISTGMTHEIEFAEKYGIPVVKDPIAWDGMDS